MLDFVSARTDDQLDLVLRYLKFHICLFFTLAAFQVFGKRRWFLARLCPNYSTVTEQLLARRPNEIANLMQQDIKSRNDDSVWQTPSRKVIREVP